MRERPSVRVFIHLASYNSAGAWSVRTEDVGLGAFCFLIGFLPAEITMQDLMPALLQTNKAKSHRHEITILKAQALVLNFNWGHVALFFPSVSQDFKQAL